MTKRDNTVAASASQVARYLGISRSTVLRLPPTELPYFRVSTRGDRRYRWPDIYRWETLRRVTE